MQPLDQPANAPDCMPLPAAAVLLRLRPAIAGQGGIAGRAAQPAVMPCCRPTVPQVDHGKSTLADRLLEATGAIAAGGQAQVGAWGGRCFGLSRGAASALWSVSEKRLPSLPSSHRQYLDKLQVERERGITVKVRCTLHPALQLQAARSV